MKNTLFLSIIICLFCIGCSNNASNKIQENDNSKPSTTTTPINAKIIDEGGSAAFEFNNEGGTVWDFGTIIQDEAPSFEFTFTNTGNEPMIISNAKGSCGCTVPIWPKEPIAPGATGTINVKFNSKGKKGTQNKTVTLTANTTPPTTKLRVTGEITVPQ